MLSSYSRSELELGSLDGSMFLVGFKETVLMDFVSSVDYPLVVNVNLRRLAMMEFVFSSKEIVLMISFPRWVFLLI